MVSPRFITWQQFLEDQRQYIFSTVKMLGCRARSYRNIGHIYLIHRHFIWFAFGKFRMTHTSVDAIYLATIFKRYNVIRAGLIKAPE